MRLSVEGADVERISGSLLPRKGDKVVAREPCIANCPWPKLADWFFSCARETPDECSTLASCTLS